MKLATIFFLFLISLLTIACGGSKDNPDDQIEPIIESPEPALLIFPVKDEECNEGIIVSELQSKVTFEWNKAKNTDSYAIALKNLNTLETEEINTKNTSKEITLNRSTPYAWKIISRGNKTDETAESDTWNLYNAGSGYENYAPFPARLISPLLNSQTATEITLTWEGTDIDNDIKNYSVYLDTTISPTSLLETTEENFLDITLQPSTLYYWKVVIEDQRGNTSSSEIYSFTTE